MDIGTVEAVAQSPPTGLAGRGTELARLSDVLSGATEAHPGAVLVHGEAGVGKTSLVAVASEQARADGAAVLWGSCVHFGAASSPYQAFASALESATREASSPGGEPSAVLAGCAEELLPRLRGEKPGVVGLILHQIDAAVGELAADRPTVLVVDDLQWADLSSLDAIAYLLSGLRNQRLALLMTYRDEELTEGHHLHAWLAETRRLPAVTDISLERLTRDQTGRQIRTLTGADPPDSLVEDVFTRSAGNPYLSELLVEDLDPGARHLTGDLPPALRSALLARWHTLSPAARAVVQLLAVAGRPAENALLIPVGARVGIDAHAIPKALHEAAHAGVVQRDSVRTVWFRHPLLAEVLYETLLPGEAEDLHAAFVAVLEEQGARDPRSLADLALHHERAGNVDDAFTYCIRAAERAEAVQASPEQTRLLRSAARLWPQVSPAAQQEYGSEALLLARTSWSSRSAGDAEGAWEAIERARTVLAQRDDPRTTCKVLTLWGEIGMTSGKLPDYPLEVFRQAVEVGARYPQSWDYAFALSTLAETEARQGEAVLASCHADEAVEAARRSGDAGILSFAVGARSFVHLAQRSGADDAEEAFRLAVESREADWIGVATITRCNALEARGRLVECALAYAEGFARASEHGRAEVGPLLATYAAFQQVRIGRFDQAREMLREALAGGRRGMTGIQARLAGVTLAVRTGRMDEARAHLEHARELAPRLEEHLGLCVPSALAEHMIARGEHQQALRLLTARLPSEAVADRRYGDELLLLGASAAASWAERCRDARDPEGATDAQRALGRLEQLRESSGSNTFADDDPVAVAVHMLFDAERARCHAGDDVVSRWRVAAQASCTASLRWDEARAWLRLAEAQLVGGAGRTEAAEPLRRAHDLSSAMGAAPLQQEAGSLARLARIPLDEVSIPTQEESPALAGLTLREREVLGHLVAGRSYREIARALFISEKTVSVHVSNLLRKTGTSNRNEAAALARRAGITA